MLQLTKLFSANLTMLCRKAQQTQLHFSLITVCRTKIKASIAVHGVQITLPIRSY
uniref:Uncharacterized protein n=1 Tax=Arundo donax TaxID=35708 RepID=A0A0A9EE98_ARUDO